MGSLKEKLLFVVNLKLMIEYMQKKGQTISHLDTATLFWQFADFFYKHYV
jgi:hypothetical protein